MNWLGTGKKKTESRNYDRLSVHPESTQFSIFDSRRLVEIPAQLFTEMWVAQLAQRDRLNLPNAFARDAKLDANFFERSVAAIFQAIAQLNNLALTLRELLQNLFDLLAQHRGGGGIGRRRDPIVLDKVAHPALAFLPNWHLKRKRVHRCFECAADLVRAHAHCVGDLLGGWLALHSLLELMRGALDLADRLAHMHRQPYSAALIGDRAGDRLADPPRCIGGKFMTFRIIELLDRAHQANITLLDQIHHGQAIGRIFLSDRDNQAQVGLDQMLPGLIAACELLLKGKSFLPRLIIFAIQAALGEVAGFHLFGERHFLLSGEEWNLANFLEVHAHRVIERNISQIGEFREEFIFDRSWSIGYFGRRLNQPNALGLEGRVELNHVGDVMLWLGERLENVAVGEIPLRAGDLKQLLQHLRPLL